MKEVLIIVPAYNEENIIGNVIDRIKQKAGYADIIVVDDASTDNTKQVAIRSGVKVISLPINLGIGGAVQTGFKYAKENGYNIAVQIDGDGQHDPTHIPALMRLIEEENADVVIGSRYLEDCEYDTPLARRIGMIIFSLITTLICRQKITDTTSGFRVINLKAIEFFAKEYPVDFPDAEALILLHRTGLVIKEIPVTMNQRNHGESSTGLLKSIYYPFKSLLGIIAGLLSRV